MEEPTSGLQEIFVFIGSPSDVENERRIFKKIIDEINETTARSKGRHLSVAAGEYAPIGKSRPEERIIDKELKKSKLCIFILWKRFGSDTGEYSSGTEEEFNFAMDDKEKEVMLFFREIPKGSKDDPEGQLKKVLEFKETVKKEKKLLYKEYKKPKDFEKLLRINMYKWLESLDRSRSNKIDRDIITKSMTYDISNEAIIEDKNKLEKDNINILIENNKVPYFSTPSNDSDCILFADIFGFSVKTYFYSNEIMTLEKLENILEIYYENFRKDFQFKSPSFLISQTDEENGMHYSWFGYGYKNFIKALKEREKRYSEAGIIRPHHSESAGFIADGSTHIFYIAVLPEVFRENSFEVDVGFVFENLLFDNKKYIEFYKRANLDLPEFIYDRDYEGDVINLRQKNLELKPEGLISYKFDADKEDWVSGIICKNPFYNDKKTREFLSRHEKIVVNLRSHHPLKIDKQYNLEEARIIQIPYGVFGFKILNIRGDW
ncbi:MAG: DUF4062 domain-containing protein [Candidatus Methanoperedens sp.]|nr:DUF4062 domain-containing protein [Candidatus Methanoperedens sp.]